MTDTPIEELPADGELVVDIQLGGYVTEDSELTIFAQVPNPDDGNRPLARVQLSFVEDLADPIAINSMLQLFSEKISELVERVDAAREEAQRG